MNPVSARTQPQRDFRALADQLKVSTEQVGPPVGWSLAPSGGRVRLRWRSCYKSEATTVLLMAIAAWPRWLQPGEDDAEVAILIVR